MVSSTASVMSAKVISPAGRPSRYPPPGASNGRHEPAPPQPREQLFEISERQKLRVGDLGEAHWPANIARGLPASARDASSTIAMTA
jgi:hypothetical protein